MKWFAYLPLSMALAVAASLPASAQERIVLLRHGEKPAQGLGQLTCKGLNRALLLPAFLAQEFPRPDYIFAPDPSVKACELHGDGQCYDYVRPLVTIDPTAIRLGMPVDTQIAYNDIGRLADTLLGERYRKSTVLVAWEHLNIVHFSELVLRRLGSSAAVPDWSNGDYDTIFELLVGANEPRTVQLKVHTEKLGELSDSCPTGVSH
ncbi:MAG TPA: histidine phosphatase family protein [Myxococcota bacterium]|nr:histidine phosphatase family protein [Myxococcota bacterium]